MQSVWHSGYWKRTSKPSGVAISDVPGIPPGLCSKKLGLELNIYAPRKQPALVKLLQHRHRNALIVGHSNTIPELAQLLCGCSITDMDESEYGRLIIITIAANEITVETLL